jgi:cytochrome c556
MTPDKRRPSDRMKMPKRALAAAIAVVGLFGIAAIAAEKPSDEYQKAMKDLGGVAQSLSKPEATEDFPAVTKSVETAKAAWTTVEKYWRTKATAEDAMKLVQAGSKAAADMGVAANLTSAEGVQAALKDMTDTCRACHEAHREKQADGTFLIK